MRASRQPRPGTGNAGMWAGRCAGGRRKHGAGMQSGDRGIPLYTWGSVDAHKLTLIAGSERHRVQSRLQARGKAVRYLAGRIDRPPSVAGSNGGQFRCPIRSACG